ncbi:MAG: glycosyltransferase family 4 protein [Candidatus Obscuribacterales bacterium]
MPEVFCYFLRDVVYITTTNQLGEANVLYYLLILADMAHRKVLLITLEPVAQQMAGPAIRAVELGKELARDFDVTVFSPRETDVSAADLSPLSSFKLATGARPVLYECAENADVLFVQGNVLKAYPRLSRLGKYLAVDLYDPYLLSVLAQYAEDTVSSAASYNLMHQVLERHMVNADFSVCASERQRDYWLGRYCALGRLTPDVYREDPTFRRLIDVVPFGLPAADPVAQGPGAKGHVKGIDKDDFLLLWGGGIWEWFDPLTVIRAVGALAPAYPQLKLYFMGFKSPNPQVDVMPMARRSLELAKELNLLDKHVFFCETWTPYAQRVNYLLDADAAVSAHFDVLETRFSFRTRILDYLWAGLPVLSTRGDQLADDIQEMNAGVSLPFEDVGAWAEAIKRLIEDRELTKTFAENSKQLARKYRWDQVVSPLRQFCAEPHRLPSFKRVRMPSLLQRAHAVYSRGGKDLVLRRGKEVLHDLLGR